MRRVGLVGAGFISRVHAEVLAGVADVRTAAIIDPDRAAAQRLARQWKVENVFASVEEALAADAIDCAHVLVPPDLHARVAMRLIEAGKPVLLEKPAAASAAECAVLAEAALRHGVTVGVNQNFVHHPAFARLRKLLHRGELGRANHVSCVYNVPLRQLGLGQFGHWMFREPVNILLEQAVHPLSQLAALAGTFTSIQAIAGPAIELAPGRAFHSSVDAHLTGTGLPAQLRFAVGQSFPFWQVTVVCDDGVAVADILANRVLTYRRTRWLETIDGMASGSRSAAELLRHSLGNTIDYGLSTFKLRPRSDAFFRSMAGSISAFHAALSAGLSPETDLDFGAGLVLACETIRDQAFAPACVPATVEARPPTSYDVAVLGGTGFIGTHVVRRLVADGLRVSVMARSVASLPAVFADPLVAVHRGSIADPAAVARAIGDAPVVVNLAHGGGGGDFEEIRAAMVGGAETVARACQAAGVRRLIHVGSIASLYLGPQSGCVTDATQADPAPEKRADYARAKAICDRMLLDLHAREGLPVCILRPGLVVGAGGSPFHSGLGFYNNEQHCIGWNAGRNPLPFVLVEDVAEAIRLACTAGGLEGRTYNLVGDVRMTARDYVSAVGQALRRPLRFHPQTATQLWLEDMGKWSVKRATGRKVAMPTRYDFLSRGMTARFDCSAAKHDLGWVPVAEPARFLERAVQVHAA